MTGSRIIDSLWNLLGDTVILRHSHLFAKLPGNAKRVARHQDASSWPLSPSRVITAWLAIDDGDNSAMGVIPRSHHHAQLAFRDSSAADNSVPVQNVDNPGNSAMRLSPRRCGPVRFPCTATGSCTAPNQRFQPVLHWTAMPGL